MRRNSTGDFTALSYVSIDELPIKFYELGSDFLRKTMLCYRFKKNTVQKNLSQEVTLSQNW
jgi:hypothetical protein